MNVVTVDQEQAGSRSPLSLSFKALSHGEGQDFNAAVTYLSLRSGLVGSLIFAMRSLVQHDLADAGEFLLLAAACTWMTRANSTLVEAMK